MSAVGAPVLVRPRPRAPTTGSDALTGRVPAIDGLRVIALLVVFAQHSGLGPAGKGGAAVDVFFVISGYVITRLLMKEYDANGRISARRFYLARWRRLVPAAAVVCGIVAAVSLVLGGRWAAEWRYAVLAITSTLDLSAAQGHISRLLVSFWTLSVEEQFYLLWPWALAALLRLSRRRAQPLLPVVVLVGLCVVPLVERCVLVGAGQRGYVYYSPDTRLDQLLYGCAFALAFRAVGDRTIPPALRRAAQLWAWPTAVVLGAAASTWTTQVARTGWSVSSYLTIGMTTTALLTVLLLATFVLAPQSSLTRLVGWRPLAWMGRQWSYGFYLFHWPVIVWFNRLGWRHHSAMAFATTLLASIASWWFVERRFRRPHVAGAPAVRA